MGRVPYFGEVYLTERLYVAEKSKMKYYEFIQGDAVPAIVFAVLAALAPHVGLRYTLISPVSGFHFACESVEIEAFYRETYQHFVEKGRIT